MSLEDLRREIDRVDAELVRLLNERARQAVGIGREKQRRGAPVLDPAREAAVLERVRELNRGPLSDAALSAIYRKILEACAGIQSEG
jgi:chorismate mutase / prephenate dehydratase